MARLVCAAAILSVALSGQSPVNWIQGNAVRLSTVEAGNGFNDLEPLKKMIGDARIVSLGEATHGTREFFQLKHRMLEFLATQMGFSIFSIEANMPEAYRLNDYVLNGTGDPAQLLKGMYFWTWDTEEVLDMIRWMRNFNASGKGRLQFTGFDMQTSTVARQIAAGFVSKYDPAFAPTIQEAIQRLPSAPQGAPANAFGMAGGSFPVHEARGKKIRFSGYIKTEQVVNGYAGLWWRVDGPAGTLAFDNMQARGARGTTDWTMFTIELPVDASARNIMFGVLMPGGGTAWFDDLLVTIDGVPFLDPNLFDFTFESPALKGLNPTGAGYTIALDAAVARGGRQSLRIRRTAPMPTANAQAAAGDSSAAAARWTEVVAHLEARRARYRPAGATDTEIEWAIQNARVVVQSLPSPSGGMNRDRSMAANVKWIADQNPKDKIVLWAHNGHVATAGFGESMGRTLRTMFGPQMFVFGFSFGEGSFQSISQGDRALKAFTVPLAPADSLDATLAAANIPIFALDLRRAPEWFAQPRAARQIGSMYPEDSPFAFMPNVAAAEAFDGILFVRQTTAARKNK